MSLPDIIDLEGGGQNNYESRVYRLIHNRESVLEGLIINGKKVDRKTIETALDPTNKKERQDLIAELKMTSQLSLHWKVWKINQKCS